MTIQPALSLKNTGAALLCALALLLAPSFSLQAQKMQPVAGLAEFNKAMTLFEEGEIPKGLPLLLKSATLGLSKAMFELGGLYDAGAGVEMDAGKARKWYKKAAKKNHVLSMYNLGYMHAKGYGGTKDLAKARHWYEMAGQKNHAQSMYYLANLYARGQGGAVDFTKARHWYKKAADNNHPRAMYELGKMLARGEGGPKDIPMAREILQKAANEGLSQAARALALLKN